MVWCRMMYKPCADVKPVVTKIRPEMHVDSLSSSEISLQIIIFHWIECIIRKNQDYVYGICKCKLLGTTEKYFKGIDKWKNFDSLISLDVLKIYNKGRNVNRLSVIMWISYHVNVCVCILYIYICPPDFVLGVGGAVRFLVVGTIGQGERPPRGQLWMEQCLTSLKYWPI